MILNQLTSKDKNSIGTMVYDYLKEEILNLSLPPGLSISENEIAEKLNVSRTPVREAFLRLSQENLISVYPQKGSIVSLIDLDHLEETRFMREHLEVETVKLACETFSNHDLSKLKKNIQEQEIVIKEKNYKQFLGLDDEFHSLIFSGCNKSRIWNVIKNMMSINFDRVRLLSLYEKFNWETIIS
ncbi:DNA-binding GntR family transcriptional regulator [Caldalkalibacillus uzonensis]|uniref:DNA-binding GntR family transcriptional regulator n=1 Tax=Caldalkalibacillus uzonensis TaxID=353224 RepID=A0ABU0CPM9_9BACI|nr:GntR family transcriptional regulator [Caldalkalibacillus uzonensis]MDQ0338043.1 DNA-binding GntR family transcriptional regulator [Caldalkalibacillus uzonensis]